MMATLVSRGVTAGLIAAFAGEAAAVEWNVSLWGERRASTEHVHELAELVAEKTDGAFTMNIDYGGLSKNTENLDGLSLGAFEMAQFCAAYHADKNPTLTVLELPFLGVSTMAEEIAISRAVYSHPAVKEDLARWNAMLLMPSPTPGHSLVGVGEPPDSVAEFQASRVRAIGGLGQAFEAVGAVATPDTSVEAYEALETGVVDMVAFAPHAHVSFGTLELADWWLANLHPGTVNCPIAVSIDAYQSLSAEHRSVLHRSVDEAMQHYVKNYRRLLEDWDSILEAHDVERVTLPEAELEKFMEAAAPIRETWVERMEAQGLPAKELLDLVRRTLREGDDASN